MITVTVQGDTPELLAAHVAWLHAKLGGEQVIAEVKARKQADKAIEKAKAEPAPAVEQPTEAAIPASVATLEEVRAKLTAVSQGGKKAEVKALIAEYGVSSVTALPSEKYGEILEKAAALA